MTIFDFIHDLQTNAPPERGGLWLLQESRNYPALAKAIIDNLEDPPTVVIEAIAQHWPLARIYSNSPKALEYIQNLQHWLRQNSAYLPQKGLL